MSNWIDINDSLPKDRQQVLIAHREGGVMQADYEERWIKSPEGGTDHRFKTPYGEELYDAVGEFVEITHWMPLPISPVMQKHYMAQARERRNKSVDWFDSCRPDDRD